MPLQIFDGADRGRFALKHRPLLDVQFNIGMRFQKAGLRGAGVTYAREFRSERRAIGSDRRKRGFDRKAAHMNKRPQHIGRVAHPLLVGKGRDDDRADRRESLLLQCLDDFEGGQHAVAAIVDAGIDDRVDMGAEH